MSFFQYISGLKTVFILANSAEPDEMPPCAAFHLGLHCLPKYLFMGIQNETCCMSLEMHLNYLKLISLKLIVFQINLNFIRI